jgi:hypothetical protein
MIPSEVQVKVEHELDAMIGEKNENAPTFFRC